MRSLNHYPRNKTDYPQHLYCKKTLSVKLVLNDAESVTEFLLLTKNVLSARRRNTDAFLKAHQKS